MNLLAGIRQVIAVVGCQRSGTTLTAQIAGADARAVLLDEWDGLYPWFHALGSGEESGLAAELLHRAVRKYRVPGERFAQDGFAAGIEVLVLKAPNLTFHPQRLAALAAPVRIVYPVRDPRAVVASMMRLSHIDFLGNQRRLMEADPVIATLHKDDVAVLADAMVPTWVRYASIWKIKSGRAGAFRAAGLEPLQFRYEDLVSGGDVIPRLAAFCGLDAAALAAPHGVYVGSGPGDTDRTRPIDTASSAAWREALDAGQQADVLAAAGDLAREFAYV